MPDRQSPGIRTPTRAPVALALLGPAFVVSCFQGDQALGLPCNDDLDCGLGQACEQGFCGGPPDTSAETSATDASTGGSAETQTDETTAGTDTSTSDTSGSNDTGTPECGNGVLEMGEECEPTLDALCRPEDCTIPFCGDDRLDPPLDEHCDENGLACNGDEFDGCTGDCVRPLFADNLQGEPDPEWTTETLPTDGVPEWTSAPGEWRSPYLEDQAALVRLWTPSMTFEPKGSCPLTLRFKHKHGFEVCGTMQNPEHGDGAIVQIQIGGPATNPMQIFPPRQNPQIDDVCTAISEPPNPLVGASALVGSTDGDWVPVSIPLDPVQPGDSFRIGFTAGFDCGNCGNMHAPNAIAITDVIVAQTCEPQLCEP